MKVLYKDKLLKGYTESSRCELHENVLSVSHNQYGK